MLLIGGERCFEQVLACVIVDGETQADAFAFSKAEAAVIVVFFEVEVFGSVEVGGGEFSRDDAVQGEVAFVVVALVAADKVEARALLHKSQGHDPDCAALAA